MVQLIFDNFLLMQVISNQGNIKVRIWKALNSHVFVCYSSHHDNWHHNHLSIRWVKCQQLGQLFVEKISIAGSQVTPMLAIVHGQERTNFSGENEVRNNAVMQRYVTRGRIN